MSDAKHSPLLPCPFCGSSDIDAAFAKWGDGAVSPGCMSCGATAETQEDWNTRAATSLHHELVAALATALSQWSMYADLIGRKDEDVCLLDEQSMEGTLYRHVRAALQKAKQGDKQ